MNRQIFVNLPVNDLQKSIGFYEAIGFSLNKQFTDETAACMVISPGIHAMLLTHDKFKEFTPKAIADATKTTEVLTAISCDSRSEVEELVTQALAAGGSRYAEANDLGFMFQDGFQDLDGHIWELVWMDPVALEQALPS